MVRVQKLSTPEVVDTTTQNHLVMKFTQTNKPCSCPKAFYTRSSLHNHVKTHGHQFYADK